MAVTLYRQVGKGKARRYQKVNLGRGRRPADLTVPYFLRYSLADGTRPWEHVGDDLDEAIAARERKQAYFEALDANVPVVQEQDETGRTKITDALYQWFSELQLFQGKDQQGKSEKTLRAYNYRLGFFLDFTAQNNLRYLDQIDRKQLLRYVKFLRDHESDLDDRTVHNVFETLNTFLRTRDIFIAGKILAELDYAEKPPKPYTKQELPEGWTMPVCINDARPGGKFRYEWRNGKGRGFHVTGEYLELDPHNKLVHVERMHLPDPTPNNHVETRFDAEGAGTLMTMRMTLPDAKTRAAMLETGMERGMEASYVRLEGMF